MNFLTRKGYKKHHNGKFGSTTKGTEIEFGELGLVALSSGQIREKSFRTVLQVLKKRMKDKGRIFVRTIPDYGVTSRSIGKKMGGGAGKTDHVSMYVKTGKVLVEISGLSKAESLETLKIAKSKLPIKGGVLFRRT